MDRGSNRQAAVQLERAKQETREAVDAARDYAFAQREEFATRIRAEVATLREELHQLSGRADQASATVKAESAPRVEAIQNKVAQLSDRLEQLKQTSEPKWEEFKTEIKAAYTDAKESVRQAREWLSEKIAPKQ